MKKIYLLTLLLLWFLVDFSRAQTVNPLQSGHYAAGFINVRDLTNPLPGMFNIIYAPGILAEKKE